MRRRAPTFSVIFFMLALLLTSCGRRDEPLSTLVTPTALPTYTPAGESTAEAETETEAEAGAPANDDGEAEAELVEMAAAAAQLVTGRATASPAVTGTPSLTPTAVASVTQPLSYTLALSPTAAAEITPSVQVTAAEAAVAPADATSLPSVTVAVTEIATAAETDINLPSALPALLPGSFALPDALADAIAGAEAFLSAFVAPVPSVSMTVTPEPQAAATVALTSTLPALPTLHVPSPDWREQIIYFVMTDRFADGDPANNDQGFDEYDPADPRKYSGGDIQGLIDRLDYIQDLGATAVWITPPVANQWWNPWVEFGGYHGYWAEDFMAVDAHLGTLADYQALSRELHGRGMYLIQDIVTNHTGDFFTYKDDAGQDRYNPLDPTANFRLNAASLPVTAPTQAPFDQNDATDPADLNADIYHWTPQIQNYDNVEQRLTYQLADLDDLNTTNPQVREALRESYAHWIREVGVDGFRIDTVIYVEHDFWNDFVHGADPATPGMNEVAAETGRENFLTFGEAFIGSEPYDDAGEQAISAYLGSPTRPELMSVLNFPMHFTINRVFAEGAPTAQMAYRLDATKANFPDPALLPNFIDNHDVARFLSKGTTAGLRQALTFLMTAPGIPVIYYGTEQGFIEQRGAMFAGGFGSGGVDRFDPESELYGFIQALTELRKANPVFTRGAITVLQSDPHGPGVLAYARQYGDVRAIVIMNTADKPVLMRDLATGLPAGTVLESMLDAPAGSELVVQTDGRMTMALDPRQILVLDVTDRVDPVTTAPVEFAIVTPLATTVFTETLAISGTVSVSNAPLKLILNDDLARAVEIVADSEGAWQAEAPLAGIPPGRQENSLQIWAPEEAQVSDVYFFTTDLEAIESSVTVYDLIGDTVGPEERYKLPTDGTFGQQLDIVQTTVRAAGPDLVVELTMAEVTDGWDPANGFDHVLFHVFVDIPGQDDGATVLPHLNAAAPEGFAWNYLAFVEGWNNRLFAATDAGPDAYGAPVTPVATVETDVNAGVVTLRLAGEALGNPATLAGARVYVTTWDWNGVDSEYRRLTEVPQQWTFGGGDGAVDPLILDDTDIIMVPAGGDVVANEPPGEYVPPGGFTPLVDVTLAATVPPSTPAEATIYATGPWASWNPADERFAFSRGGDGTYRLTVPVEEGTIFEYRITRGSFANAEKYDPANRAANRVVDVPTGKSELIVPVDVSAWWDE
jgi:glycosidase